MALRCSSLVLSFLLITMVWVPTSAQLAQAPPTAPKHPEAAYPNTSEGLQSLVEAILHAAKSKDTAIETELIHGLLVPEDSKWFSDEFGPGFGASLSATYRSLELNMGQDLQVIFENDVQRGWMKPKIFRYADAASSESPVDKFLNCMDEVVPLYQTAVDGKRTTFGFARDPSQMGKITAGDPHGYFAFIQGSFRFIPQEVLMVLPKGRPVRIKLEMDVMNSKIMNKTPIQVPPQAIEKHISGKVVVEVILDVEGNIKELKVLEGDPILSDSVMETVRKWKFEPTKLDGDPVEVDLQIPFVFQVR
jgi:TonB family protein